MKYNVATIFGLWTLYRANTLPVAHIKLEEGKKKVYNSLSD